METVVRKSKYNKTLTFFVITWVFFFAAGFGAAWSIVNHDVKERQTAYESQLSNAPYPELDAAHIAALVNEQRSVAGLSTLSYNAQLEASACAKADDMIAKDYWAHVSPSGTPPWTFFYQVGYNYYKAGENLAYGQRSDSQIVSNWMGSPTHKANIVGPFTEQGMCVRYAKFQGINAALIVNHFGAR